MNASATATTKAANSPDDVSQQIEALRADFMKLAATITSDVSGGIEKAGNQISQGGRDAQTKATNAVLDHPLTAVGIAACVGLLLGLVVRKG